MSAEVEVTQLAPNAYRIEERGLHLTITAQGMLDIMDWCLLHHARLFEQAIRERAVAQRDARKEQDHGVV